MKREASAVAELHDLEARIGPVRPGWLWGLLAFVTAATLTAFALALSSPFGANELNAIPAYDAGFVDGLRGGQDQALVTEREIGTTAFRRGLNLARVSPSETTRVVRDSAWLLETVDALSAMPGLDAFARGYDDGYTAGAGGVSE